MDSFDDIQDMSVDGGTAWQIVTLLVGKERRGFQAHLQSLGPLVAALKLSPGNEVPLPEWDADVFNLIMNWTYNVTMPRVWNMAKHFVNTDCSALDPDLSRPDADQFIPHEIPEEPTLRFYNVTAKPAYQKFSVDELRLHFAVPVNARASKKELIRQTDNQPDNEVDGNIQHEGQELEKSDTLSRSSIPSSIPDEEAVKADRDQILLLKLMIFAENYKWEPLFNDAMDAFSYGETQLRRLYTPTSHIDLAFSHTPPPPTVRYFMLDYVLALGSRHNTMSQYQDAILSHPEILSFMLSRMDLRTPASFGALALGTSNELIDHGDPTRDAYHLHDGELVIGCTCRGIGGFYLRNEVFSKT